MSPPTGGTPTDKDRGILLFQAKHICIIILSNAMSFLPPSDYTLTKLLGENKDTNIWLAEQVSVRRNVVLVQLRDPESAQRDNFIAAVRAKAAVDHPLIASVYEAINDARLCFFSREWLPGENLAEKIERRCTLKPAVMAHILKRVAEANMYLDDRGIATEPLHACDIYLNEQNVLRLENLVTSGTRSQKSSEKDIEELGKMLPALVESGVTGTTRILTLLHWMSGADPEHVMHWKEIRQYADHIDQQLATPVVTMNSSTRPKPGVVKPSDPRFKYVIGAAVLLTGVAVMAIANKTMQRKTKAVSVVSAEPILVTEGTHPGPDGIDVPLRQFWLSPHEVTIGEYQQFLKALALLPADQRAVYDHEDQTASKKSHAPEQWDEITAAAEARQVWKSRKMSPDCPVSGVDWWDAYAYCEWKRARLPTQEEWHAAMRLQTENPRVLKPGVWGDVQSLDCNKAGFFGMAGGVSEWTRKPAGNPSNPLGAREWVLIGASYARPENGALAREWTMNRDLKREDIGFRIAYDHLSE